MDKKNIIIALAITSLLLGLTVTVSAQEDPEQTTEINVSIASEVALDVQPETLNFQNINIGEQHNVSDGGFDGITVENIGSEYIDSIWVESSTPADRPFGSGDASLYDSGNFIQIKPDFDGGGAGASEDNYFFVNRKEFNEPVNLDYINAPLEELSAATGNDAEARYVGRFRNADEEIFWVLITDDTSDPARCDPGLSGVNTELRVGDTPHTPEGLGTTDFTDTGEDYTAYTMDEVTEINDAGYGIAGSNVPLQFGNKTLDYAVFGGCEGDSGIDTTNTVRTKYNVGIEDADDLTADTPVEYIFETTTGSDMLVPGETFVLPTAISVPTGVVQGEVTTGTLTLLATADESQTE